MKKRNMLLITVLSFIVCAIHAVILNTQYNNYVLTSAIKLIAFILCPMIYFSVTKTGKIEDLILRIGHKKYIKQALWFSVIVFAFILVGFIVVRSQLERDMIVRALLDIGITSKNYPLVFVYIVFVNAALEELFFRGFVFLTIYRGGHKRYAYIYSAVLFALYHVAVVKEGVTIGALIMTVAGLAVAGLIFNELTRRCKSVVGSLAVHIAANVAINLIGVYYLYFYKF